MLRLSRTSGFARRWVTTPEVSVTVVAPAPYAVARLSGRVRRLGTDGDDGRSIFYRFTVTGVRLDGATESVDVPLAEYRAAEDEPISAAAPGMLAHLAEAHADALLATVKAHVDSLVEVVVPRSLDGYGLSLTTVTPTGVGELTLAFPGAPLHSARDVAACVRAALSCPCQTRRDLRAHHHDL